MADNRIKEDYVSGKGVLTGYIAIFKPSTKFNEKGVYSLNILLDEKEGKALTAKVKEIAKEQFKAYGKGKKISEITCIKPFATVNEEGEEVSDPENRYILKTSAKAWIEDGVPSNKILVVDASKKPIKNLNIGQGTIAKVFVSLEGYTTPKETNVTVVLKAVQIINFVEKTGVTIDMTGFEVEDGFTIDNDEETSDSETTTAEVSDEEGDF